MNFESQGLEKKELKVAETYTEGLNKAKEEITTKLQEKENLLVSIAGKSGSGKSHFSGDLRENFLDDNIDATIISSDDFYIENEDPTKKELNLEKLQSTIKKLQKGEAVGKYQPSKLLIIEGLQTIKNDVLGQEADYRVFIDTDFSQRMGRRLLRDEKNNYRTINKSMEIITDFATNNPEVLKKFEGEMDMSGVDMKVFNDYIDPNDPKLYIKDNKFIFKSSEGEEEIELDEKQVEALKNIGFNIIEENTN